MNEVRNEELIQLSMRRELTPEETSRLEAHFDAHPEARASWEEERALSRAVQSLPDVPVSSNFTSRVLQALDTDERRARGRSSGRGWLPYFLPRFGWAAVAVLLGLFVAQGIRTGRRAQFEQAELAKDVSFAAADLAKLPNPEILLQDFDAINQLGQASAISDDELLKALQ